MNHDGMRPEYVDAINRALFGAGFWTWLLLPPLLILTIFIFRPFLEKSTWWILNLAVFGFCLVFFWGFGVYHAHDVQGTKQSMMETDAEIDDWQSDVGVNYSIITLIPASVIYCTFWWVVCWIGSMAVNAMLRLIHGPTKSEKLPLGNT